MRALIDAAALAGQLGEQRIELVAALLIDSCTSACC